MDLQKITTDLIGFRTETGNLPEIEHCLEYVKSLFAATPAEITLYRKNNLAPVLLLANTREMDFDVLAVGHLDVVPADDALFNPVLKQGRMYGRGTLDMKSFAAVALNSLEYVLEENLPIKFGVLLSTDEEKGSFGLDAFLKDYPDLKSKLVLDIDVAGDIGKIIAKCKNPVFVKIAAQGKEAHGSTPWDGIDANEKLFQVWQNIRQLYPYFSEEMPQPQNKWIDTVHFAKIEGGAVANVISNYAEALLDFRLTERSTLAGLADNLKKCMVSGTEYKIISSGAPVVMDENNPDILRYKKLLEEVLQKECAFEHIGGATDSHFFAARGSVVIMNSGSGNGMHAAGEYVEWQSVEQLAEVQKRFLKSLVCTNN